jgi:hypothetical protein
MIPQTGRSDEPNAPNNYLSDGWIILPEHIFQNLNGHPTSVETSPKKNTGWLVGHPVFPFLFAVRSD